jgi:hypothetical protein
MSARSSTENGLTALRICRRILPRPHCNSYWLCVSGAPALNRAVSGNLRVSSSSSASELWLRELAAITQQTDRGDDVALTTPMPSTWR